MNHKKVIPAWVTTGNLDITDQPAGECPIWVFDQAVLLVYVSSTWFGLSDPFLERLVCLGVFPYSSSVYTSLRKQGSLAESG